MSLEDVYSELERRCGLTRIANGQAGTVICTYANHTHFQIPDPREVPESAWPEPLDRIEANLGRFALGY